MVDDADQQRVKERFVIRSERIVPIRSVHVGPSPLGEESIDALREFVEFSGYPDVRIDRRATPPRCGYEAQFYLPTGDCDPASREL